MVQRNQLIDTVFEGSNTARDFEALLEDLLYCEEAMGVLLLR